MPPIVFRIRNGKQTPSGTRILRRVRRQLLRSWHSWQLEICERELVPLAIADIDLCLSKCYAEWLERF